MNVSKNPIQSPAYYRRAEQRNKARDASPQRLLPLALLLAITAPQSNAGDWINPGDESDRHHLEYLLDQATIPGLVSTWPLDLKSLQNALASVDTATLTTAERQSYDALFDSDLSHAFSAYAQIGYSRQELRGFSNDSREQSETGISFAGRSERFAANLALSFAENPKDGQTLRWDDSYLTADWGNWTLGAGRIDRWWGPGWQSSLILSNNARPTPGLFINRRQAKRTEIPLLRKLGPWHLSLFANQLESNRFVPKAKLLGGRFTFKPVTSFEIGLTRTAQWGGKGRPQDLSSLFKLLLGHDNVGTDGIELDGTNEPGNQLGGIDFRWNHAFANFEFAFYGQYVGEDEAGAFPSREIVLAGLETPLITENTHGRLYFEASDTSLRFHSSPIFNSAYNHHIYRDGYRYRGDPLGASTDNDSRLVTVGGFHSYKEKIQVNWKALYGELNRDGIPGNNTIAPEKINVGMYTLEVIKPLTDTTSLSLFMHHLTQPIAPSTRLSRNSLSLRINFHQP